MNGLYNTHQTGLFNGVSSGLVGPDVSSGSGYCLEARMLFISMTVQPEPARKKLINDFIVGCKQDGNWNGFDILYFLASHSRQSSKLNWKDASRYTITEIFSPSFVIDRGFTSDLTTSYLTTGYNPFSGGVNFTKDSASFGVYSGTNVALQGAKDIGAFVTSPSIMGSSIGLANATLNQISQLNSTTTATNVVSDSLGLGSVVRRSSSGITSFRRGVILGFTAIASVDVVNTEWQILASASGSFSPRQISFAFAGNGLIDQLKLYNRVQTYLTALGASV